VAIDAERLEEAANDFLNETAGILKAKEILPAQHRLLQHMKRIFARQESIFMREFAKYEGKFPKIEEATTSKDMDKIMGVVSKGTSEDMGKGIMVSGGQAMEAAAEHRIADFGVGIAFDLKNPRAVSWLADNAALRVTQINETTRSQIGTIVKHGADEGWSYNRTAKEISNQFEEFRVGKPQLHIQSRAHLVAVTETGNAYEEGNRMVADDLSEAGLEMEKNWATVGDDRVSDGCRTNQAEGWIPADQAHASGHMHPLRFPGCRCDELYRRKAGEIAPEPPEDVGLSGDAWAKSLGKEEKWGLDRWQASSYERIREAQRAGKVTGSVKDAVRGIDSALNKAAPYKGEVWRGLNGLDAKTFNALKNSKTLKWDALSSSAKNSKAAARFLSEKGNNVMFKIQNKTGVDLTPIFREEAEVLLRKGASYQVASVSEQVYGTGAKAKKALEMVLVEV